MHFRREVGNPEHVILYGVSMGGIIALESIERFPHLYDATVPMCGLGGGAAKGFDHKLDYALAYDVIFGWPETWGTVDDVRDDIDFYEEVWFPKAAGEVFDPANYAKWEFIRRVTGTSEGGFYSYDGAMPMPPAVVAMAYFMTEQRAELEVRAGGKVSQNVGRVYALSDEDKAFLEGFGLPLEDWLDEMNARTDYRASRRARRYLRWYGDYTGWISTPVLMVHNIEDSITDVSHTTEYLEKVEAMGREDLLVRAYTSLPGHCNFTVPQMLHVFEATVDWLESGVPPAESDFPADLDFVPGYSPEQ
jgi:pimeloyl-ACP methyl ester carboxylesterase